MKIVDPRLLSALIGLGLAVFGCTCGDDPSGLLEAGGACTTAGDCQGGLICDPVSQTCTDAMSTTCTRSADCGVGAVCTTAGVCTQAEPGGPCAAPSECIAAERCNGGTCQPPGGEGAACTDATNCEAGLVCDPNRHVCTAGEACTGHADCGPGAICGTGGRCEQNQPGGPCAVPSNCISGEACLGGACVPGCGGELYSAENVPPNVLIVFDRSGSMNDPPGNGVRESKWEIARNATYNLLSSYTGQINFGLSMFPGLNQSCSQGMRCGPSEVNVPIGGDSSAMISAFVMGADTCSLGTPIAEALMSLEDYQGLKDTTRPNYILLLTDGMATCEDPVPVVSAFRRMMPEVKTFVVGFGGEVDAQQLGDMAEAGGTARSGDPSYYQADDAASLRAAFAAIAGQVLSCEYTLSSVPPDPDLLYVYFNGNAIPRDPGRQGGWDHQVGSNRLTFYGTACDQLQSGQVTDLTVIYGCPLRPGDDAGVPPSGDGGLDPGSGLDASDGTCTSCTQCGGEGCIIPPGGSDGTCGPCTSDFQCCLGFICNGGRCIPNI